MTIKNNALKLAAIAVFLAGFAISSVRGASAETTVHKSAGQKVYVPVYSHIYSGNTEYPFYLAATVSIRNTDPNRSITILTVDYYDSDGKLLVNYLNAPLNLGKMASVRYVVKESDKGGGSGANFIVQWKADEKVNPPIIEAIMIGTQRQQGLSFSSRGQVIEEK
ncbi:MAG: DUF3124 domain-containing protein [Thermodesulfobacteriota bacterium]